MTEQDEKIERYLREFRPKAIAALRLKRVVGADRWRRAGAIAAMVLCAATATWFAGRNSGRTRQESRGAAVGLQMTANGAPKPSRAELNRLVLEGDERWETAMAEASRKSLPRFDGARSVLKVLAKD